VWLERGEFLNPGIFKRDREWLVRRRYAMKRIFGSAMVLVFGLAMGVAGFSQTAAGKCCEQKAACCKDGADCCKQAKECCEQAKGCCKQAKAACCDGGK
jgi:hypothetical protein